MSKRLAEIGVGASAGVAVVAAYLVARAYLGETTDGEWLNFAGSMLGIMGAILITVWIPKIQARSRDRVAKARILETARSLIKELDFSKVPDIAQARGRWDAILIGLERLAFERESIDEITQDQFYRLRGVERILQKMNDLIIENKELLAPLTFEKNLAQLRDAAVRMLRGVEVTLSE